MASTHVYKLDVVSRNGDTVTVTGSVDDQPVTITVWFSHMQTLGNLAAVKQYVAGKMREALGIDQPGPTELPQYEGTFTL